MERSMAGEVAKCKAKAKVPQAGVMQVERAESTTKRALLLKLMTSVPGQWDGVVARI